MTDTGHGYFVMYSEFIVGFLSFLNNDLQRTKVEFQECTYEMHVCALQPYEIKSYII
jgi:hypothetical protein